MSDLTSLSGSGLNDCGCCEGFSAATHVTVTNRPGLPTISYRVGTHSQFKNRLLARLSSVASSSPRKLKTRNSDDFSIALLDCFATLSDVLTFYQERLANESYLRTSTERLSMQYLARLIGYQLSPGVAASTYLAFTLEDSPGAPDQATKQTTIHRGTQVQSLPSPGEMPQTFETIETLEARVEWNAMKPRLTQPQLITVKMERITIKGTNNNVKVGDHILLTEMGEEPVVKRVVKVSVNQSMQTTDLDLALAATGSKFPDKIFSEFAQVSKAPIQLNNKVISEQVVGQPWKQSDLEAMAKIQGWAIDDIAAMIKIQHKAWMAAKETGVYVFRQRAAVFGYNAPKKISYSGEGVPTEDEWEITEESLSSLFLDRLYNEISPDSYIAVKENNFSVFRIATVEDRTRTQYGLSNQTTMLTLADDMKWRTVDDKFSIIRKTTVYVQSDPLTVAEIPEDEPVKGDQVLLDDFYPYLLPGRKVIVTGEPIDQPGVIRGEVKQLAEVLVIDGFTSVSFTESLSFDYVRTSVNIYANVAKATHGETVQDIVGSGDAAQPFQHFTLQQPPLTYISAPTPSGSSSTLEVRVNELQWKEVKNLYGHGPQDHVFSTQTTDDGKTILRFGDGRTGARLPTGRDNIHATYRKGIGQDGLVKTQQLTLLMSKPLGVKGVTNPLAADGAENPESLGQARTNAPLTVLTLDRVVSLKDYEDFCRAFAGIAKALATWTWDGQQRSIFLTIAGPDGAAVGKQSSVYTNLVAALKNAGDPLVPVRVKTYRPAFFRVSGKVKVHPDYQAAKVVEEVEQELRRAFSFDSRAFGQPVMMSEVISVMQSVSGIIAIDVDRFHLLETHVLPIKGHHLQARLLADLPTGASGVETQAAELLTLDPRPVSLMVMP